MRKKTYKAGRIVTGICAGAALSLLTACGGAQNGGGASAETVAETAAETTSEASEGDGADSGEETKSSETKGLFEEFQGTDLEGNSVSQEVFADYDLTMINIWATYCGACLYEMPDLGALHEKYVDQGVQVVGICSDTVDYKGNVVADQVETAKLIAADTGANYLHIVPSGDFAGKLLPQVQVVPTTVFVDKDGKMVGKAVAGAKKLADWEAVIQERLGMLEEK